MRIATLNNAEIVIQANMNKAGDWEKAQAVAAKMVELDSMDLVADDEFEGWIQICAKWDHYQAKDIKDTYQIAKKEI